MTTDRLGMEVLEAEACWELLRAGEVGRLAVSILDHPDIFPVNYIVDRDAVPKHRFVRIEPQDLSGRRFHVVADRGAPAPAAPRAREE